MESCFYTICDPIIVGCKLFQNNLATIPVTNGYFSDGSNCYQVSGGTVIDISTCPDTPTQDIACYTATDVAQTPTVVPCLGTDYPAYPYLYTITLIDSFGVPIVANQSYTFDVVFDAQLCSGFSGPQLVPMTVVSGQSSISYIHYNDETVECGFGCTSEYQKDPYVSGNPTQLPMIVECPTEPTGTCKRLSVTISEADIIASDDSTVTMTYTDCTGNAFATYPFNEGGTWLVDICVDDSSSFAFSYLDGGVPLNSGASGAIILGPCPEPFQINSTRVSEGLGTLDITGGEPSERIFLDFTVTPDGSFNSISFTSPVTVGSLETIHLSRSGYMDLDASGNGSSNYDYDPTSTGASTLVEITSRSSGLTTGVGDSTNII